MNKYPFEIRVRIQSVNQKNVMFFKENIKKIAHSFGFQYVSINLPIGKKKMTVLKSPHVNKKARNQFEIILLKSLVILRGIKYSDDFCKKLSELKSEGVLTKFMFTLTNNSV
jgi:ribosomal protein S10